MPNWFETQDKFDLIACLNCSLSIILHTRRVWVFRTRTSWTSFSRCAPYAFDSDWNEGRSWAKGAIRRRSIDFNRNAAMKFCMFSVLEICIVSAYELCIGNLLLFWCTLYKPLNFVLVKARTQKYLNWKETTKPPFSGPKRSKCFGLHALKQFKIFGHVHLHPSWRINRCGINVATNLGNHSSSEIIGRVLFYRKPCRSV